MARMFEWNDASQVEEDTVWGEFNETQDHIVPHRKRNKTSGIIDFGDQNKRNNEACSILGFSEHISDGPPGSFGKQSQLQTNADLSAPLLDMESWPDLPSLNATLGEVYNTGSQHDSIESVYLNHYNEQPSLEKVQVQLEGEPEALVEDDKDCNFLNCDWGNIGNFDDFDRLFSTADSFFSNEMAHNGDDIFSTSSDMISGGVQPTPMPFPDLCLKPGEQFDSHGHQVEQLSGKLHQSLVGVQKRLTKSGKAPMQAIMPPAAPHVPSRDTKNIGQPWNTNQFIFSGYTYPAYPMPPVPANIQPEPPKLAATTTHRASLGSPKNLNSYENPPPEPHSRSVSMTRQEKIEKLRRRQQMQAMIAIQQQRQLQLNHHPISVAETMPASLFSPENQREEPVVGSVFKEEISSQITHEELHMGSSSDDPFIEEKVFARLHDALGKLDDRTRFCIRDSLFRLAQSATERQTINEASCLNRYNKDEDDTLDNAVSDCTKSSAAPGEAETGTNPIDRIVAHLLFNRPCKKLVTSTNEATPFSPMSYDQALAPLNNAPDT